METKVYSAYSSRFGQRLYFGSSSSGGRSRRQMVFEDNNNANARATSLIPNSARLTSWSPKRFQTEVSLGDKSGFFFFFFIFVI